MSKFKVIKRAILLFVGFSLPVCIAVYAHVHSVAANDDHEFGNKLSIPNLYEGEMVDGRRQFRLVVADSEKEILPGKITRTAGINGPFLGPTLRMKRGDNVELVVENKLNETTTMHWHGMHVPAKMDGTPHQEIDPGESWTATFPVDQRAATLWYHPHPHGSTGPQVYRGLAGQLWIDDEDTESLDLPSNYGVDDIPVIIQDRNFTARGQFRIPGGVGLGNTILINGTLDPFVSVERKQSRFRLLNGSNGRVYYIGFADEREFLQIGTDGGLLERPVATKRVILAPGERAEIIVDFSDGKEAMLKSFPEAGLLETAEMIFSGQGSGNFNLLRIQPDQTESKDASTVDTATVLCSIDRLKESDAVVTRHVRLGGGFAPGNTQRRPPSTEQESADDENEANESERASDDGLLGGLLDSVLPGGGQRNGQGNGGRNGRANAVGPRGGGGRGGQGGGGRGRGIPINGQTMDMHRVDERVRLGDTEIWELTNRTGASHPFHIHLVQFQILTRNGNTPTGADLGWKDTVLVHPGDRIRIIMKFEKYSDPRTPYMYHCHIMAHEDNGMMGQFLVVQEPKRLDLVKDKPTVVVFVYGLECEHCFEQVKLFDERLAAEKINFMVVTPESSPSKERLDSVSCEVVSDPANNWAGWFKMMHEGPAHGTLIVGADGEIQWSSTEDTPYMDIDKLIERFQEMK